MVVLALGVACSLIGHAPTALACGPLPCSQFSDVQPADGATGVALNAEVRVLFFGFLDTQGEGYCDVDFGVVRLQPEKGEPVLLRGELLERPESAQAWVVAKPNELLKADTEYAVQLELGLARDACRCDEREWVTVSTFTSGSEKDDRAPAFAGITAFTYGERQTFSSTCGTLDEFPLSPALTPAIDDFPGSRYNVYVDGELAKRYVAELATTAERTEIVADCGTTALSTSVQVQPGSFVEVRAVDLAGNESPPSDAVRVEARCPGAPTPTSNPGRNPSPSSAPTAETGSRGCTLSSPPSTNASALLWIACALALSGARRAVRRRG